MVQGQDRFWEFLSRNSDLTPASCSEYLSKTGVISIASASFDDCTSSGAAAISTSSFTSFSIQYVQCTECTTTSSYQGIISVDGTGSIQISMLSLVTCTGRVCSGFQTITTSTAKIEDNCIQICNCDTTVSRDGWSPFYSFNSGGSLSLTAYNSTSNTGKASNGFMVGSGSVTVTFFVMDDNTGYDLIYTSGSTGGSPNAFSNGNVINNDIASQSFAGIYCGRPTTMSNCVLLDNSFYRENQLSGQMTFIDCVISPDLRYNMYHVMQNVVNVGTPLEFVANEHFCFELYVETPVPKVTIIYSTSFDINIRYIIILIFNYCHVIPVDPIGWEPK